MIAFLIGCVLLGKPVYRSATTECFVGKGGALVTCEGRSPK